jgi:hypothetical protein
LRQTVSAIISAEFDFAATNGSNAAGEKDFAFRRSKILKRKSSKNSTKTNTIRSAKATILLKRSAQRKLDGRN